MKYFTVDLLNRYNDESEEVRNKAEDEWDVIAETYWKGFEEYKDRFSKSFLKQYESHGFHDYLLNKIELIREKPINMNKKDKTKISLVLSNRKNTFQIIFEGVSKFNLSFEIEEFDEWGITLLYTELFPISEKVSSAEVLFSNNGTLMVHFKKISVKKVTN